MRSLSPGLIEAFIGIHISSSIPTFFIQVSHPTPTLPIHCIRQPWGKEGPLFRPHCVFIRFRVYFSSRYHIQYTPCTSPCTGTCPSLSFHLFQSPICTWMNNTHGGHYREACVFIHTDISSSTYHFQYIIPIPLHWNLQYTSSPFVPVQICKWRIIYIWGIIGMHMFSSMLKFLHPHIASTTPCLSPIHWMLQYLPSHLFQSHLVCEE